MFCQLWAQMLSRQRAMWFWALYTGRMMLTRGFDMAASPLLFLITIPRTAQNARAGLKRKDPVIFHIAVCSPDAGLRSGLERQCMEFFARRGGRLHRGTPAGHRRPAAEGRGEGVRYDLYLLELSGSAAPVGLAAAGELRRRGAGPRWPVARTTAHAYSASTRWMRCNICCCRCASGGFRPLLARATEPEYGPSVTVNTAEGLRALPYAGIEYLECTHHIVHFHLTSGEDVPTLSLRVPFSAVAQPLLADGRFCSPTAPMWSIWPRRTCFLPGGAAHAQRGPHPIPRGREGAVRDAFQQWVQQQKYSLK